MQVGLCGGGTMWRWRCVEVGMCGDGDMWRWSCVEVGLRAEEM